MSSGKDNGGIGGAAAGYWVAGLLMAFTLVGCVHMEKTMIDEEGRQKVIATSGWGTVGTPGAVVVQLAREKSARDKGYMTVEEYEQKEGPKVEERPGLAPPKEGPPLWEAGYFWTYRVGGVAQGIYRQEITGKETVQGLPAYVMRSDQEAIMVDEVLNTIQYRKNGTEGTYTPPRRDYDWPLEVGKTWQASCQVKVGTKEQKTTRQVVVKAYGLVKVPAGEFEAFYILHTDLHGRRLMEVWYAPQVKHHAKRVVYGDKGMVICELTGFQAGPAKKAQAAEK